MSRSGLGDRIRTEVAREVVRIDSERAAPAAPETPAARLLRRAVAMRMLLDDLIEAAMALQEGTSPAAVGPGEEGCPTGHANAVEITAYSDLGQRRFTCPDCRREIVRPDPVGS